MPTLLDLPSEILERLPFGQSFLLQGARDRDSEWWRDRCTIAALALTCRTLHSVYNPLLYRILVLTSLSTRNRLFLIRTISSRCEIARYVEDLKLDLFAEKFPLRDAPKPISEEPTIEQSDASDGDWYRLLGYLFFPNAVNLKQLSIRCTRYERIPCKFQELIYAQIQCYCQGRGIGLDYEGVEQLLLAPNLQKLTLSGPYITNADKLESLQHGVSNISNLALRLVMLSPETLHTILRLPRDLHTFEFYSASMRAPSLESRSRRKFVTFSQLKSALQPHKDNLGTVRICLPSSDISLPSAVFGSLTFHNFTRLTRLAIAPEMFLGWKQCVHQDPNVERTLGPPSPITFADCLPYGLEQLTIHVVQYQRARNGNGYLLDVVRGVVAQRRQLDKLDPLELACCRNVVSCNTCRLAALTYLDQSPNVKKTEVDEIRTLCESVCIQFNWVDDYWGDE